MGKAGRRRAATGKATTWKPNRRAPKGRAADRGGRRRTLRECGGRKDAATNGGGGRQNEDGSTQHDGLPLQISANFPVETIPFL